MPSLSRMALTWLRKWLAWNIQVRRLGLLPATDASRSYFSARATFTSIFFNSALDMDLALRTEITPTESIPSVRGSLTNSTTSPFVRGRDSNESWPKEQSIRRNCWGIRRKLSLPTCPQLGYPPKPNEETKFAMMLQASNRAGGKRVDSSSIVSCWGEMPRSMEESHRDIASSLGYGRKSNGRYGSALY
jgi:hypothetical protein